MNHDYAHCEDYDVNCPKECFRAKLTEDLRQNQKSLSLHYILGHTLKEHSTVREMRG